MIRPITIRTEITLSGESYEVNARCQVLVADAIHYWEVQSVEIDCNERVILWNWLSETDRAKILDAVNTEVAGPQLVWV